MANHNPSHPSPEPNDDELDDRELYGEETEIVDLDQPLTRQPLFRRESILPTPGSLLIMYSSILGPSGIFLLSLSRVKHLLKPEWTGTPIWLDYAIACAHAPVALCFALPVLAAILCFTSDYPNFPKPWWIPTGLLCGFLFSLHDGLLWPLLYFRIGLQHTINDPFSQGAVYMSFMIIIYLISMGVRAIIETHRSHTTMISGARLLPLGLLLLVLLFVLACISPVWAESPGRIAYMLVPYVGIGAYFRLYVRTLSPEGRLVGSHPFAQRYWGYAFLLYAIVLIAVVVLVLVQ